VSIDVGQNELIELGARIRTIREERGLHLDDIVEMTRIRKQFLEGIERGDYAEFPGDVYVRGFVRTYLKTLDAESLWDEIGHLFREGQPEGGEPIPLGSCTPPARGFRPASRFWIFLLLVCALTASGWYVWYAWNGRLVSPNPPGTMDGDVSRDAVSGISPTRGVAGYGGQKTLSSDTFSPDVSLLLPVSAEMTPTPTPVTIPAVTKKLVLSASRECWIRVMRGDKIVYQDILQKGKSVSFEADARLVVTYGRPDAVTIVWNGRELGKAGSGSKVEKLFYDPDGKTGKVTE
jgi:hypothetical protein